MELAMNRPKEMLNNASIALLASGLALGMFMRAMDWIRPASGFFGW